MTAIFENNKRVLITAAYVIAILLLIAWLAPIIGGQRPYRLVQSTITGLLVGGIYALIALGIVIINKASGVFNFAHGWMMLLGGMVFYSFFAGAQVSPVAAAILALAPGEMMVALDETGKSIGSAAFAEQIGRWRDESVADAVFIIGGADGLSPELRRRARLSVAFGAATWPHQMVRVMLLEQIYRAATILAGHPYHRG